jgi:hypothetical protein
MTVVFPDIIVWSPDSANAAFVAIAREGGLNSQVPLPSANANTNANAAPSVPVNENANVDANANANADAASDAAPVGEAAPNVIPFAQSRFTWRIPRGSISNRSRRTKD